jgi:hypothetical protein
LKNVSVCHDAGNCTSAPNAKRAADFTERSKNACSRMKHP